MDEVLLRVFKFLLSMDRIRDCEIPEEYLNKIKEDQTEENKTE